jgi:hypothetical protein
VLSCSKGKISHQLRLHAADPLADFMSKIDVEDTGVYAEKTRTHAHTHARTRTHARGNTSRYIREGAGSAFLRTIQLAFWGACFHTAARLHGCAMSPQAHVLHHGAVRATPTLLTRPRA